MVVDNQVITNLNIEDNPNDCNISSGDFMLEILSEK